MNEGHWKLDAGRGLSMRLGALGAEASTVSRRELGSARWRGALLCTV
jgi:hypothetical protein